MSETVAGVGPDAIVSQSYLGTPTPRTRVIRKQMGRSPVATTLPTYGRVPNDVSVRLAALEAAVAVLQQVIPAKVSDDVFMAAVATATKDHTGKRHEFNARELLNHATVDSALNATIHGWSAKRIGKRLSRLENQHIGGYILRRVDRDRDGYIWRVEAGV